MKKYGKSSEQEDKLLSLFKSIFTEENAEKYYRGLMGTMVEWPVKYLKKIQRRNLTNAKIPDNDQEIIIAAIKKLLQTPEIGEDSVMAKVSSPSITTPNLEFLDKRFSTILPVRRINENSQMGKPYITTAKESISGGTVSSPANKSTEGIVTPVNSEELKEMEVLLKYQFKNTGRGSNFEYTATFNNETNMKMALDYEDTIFMISIHDYGKNTIILKNGVNTRMYLPKEIKPKNFEKMKIFLEKKGFKVIMNE